LLRFNGAEKVSEEDELAVLAVTAVLSMNNAANAAAPKRRYFPDKINSLRIDFIRRM
jgi:hypothetical protein